MKVYTRTTKKVGAVPLYSKVKIGNSPLWFKLGLSVQLADWDKTFSLDSNNNLTQSETKLANLMRKLDYTKMLQDIELGIGELRKQKKLTVDSVNNLIQTVVLADLRSEMDRQQARKEKALDEQRKDVKNYVNDFMAGLTGDNVTTLTAKGKRTYAYNSVKILKHFHREFLEFYKTNPVGTWDEMDERYVEQFSSFLAEKYFKTTYSRLIACLRTIMARAERDGLRTLTVPKSMFARPKVEESDKMAEIYLTRTELDALYELELDGIYEKVRDLFLIGCYTGQRFSDYSSITADNVGTTAKGNRVLRLVQKKTKNTVVVPIVDGRLVTLLERYNYNVPQLANVTLNRYIKRVCEQLAKVVPSMGELVPTILTKPEQDLEAAGKATFQRDSLGRVVKPKYLLVTTHTARRTCLTNMHLTGKFSIAQMMSISGHKTVEVFFEYLKQSADEQADSLISTAGQDGLF